MAHYSFRKAIEALSVGVLSAVGVAMGGSAIAQNNEIVPDNTLGSETSVVVPFRSNVNHITGGATRGSNLFHSFEEFGVASSTRTDFIVTPDQISDVFTRITGNNPTNIDGVIGIRQPLAGSFVLSEANLYLINPNGIVFGENAILDVDGSFSATTAAGITFGNSGVFSASNPDIPSSSLTINPSAYLFDQSTVGFIGSQASRRDLIDGSRVGLRVPNGESLTLLGGTVFVGNSSATTGNSNQTGLTAYGGKINIGAVSGIGNVEIDATDSLIFSDDLNRADIVLTGNALIDVTSGNGGEILLSARNINADGSQIIAGIRSGLGTAESQAGNISLNADGFIQLNDTFITNDVLPNGTGRAGNILIEAKGQIAFDDMSIASSRVGEGGVGDSGNIIIEGNSLFIVNNSFLLTDAIGQGNAGDISIKVDGPVTFDNRAQASSTAGTNGVGDGGDITIEASSLLVSNNSSFGTDSSRRGNAGNIFLNVDNEVRFDFGSLTSSSLRAEGSGKGGNLNIDAGSILVLNDSRIGSVSQGQGDSGNISIEADGRVVFDNSSVALSDIESGAVGNSGNVDITADFLLVLNGSQVSSGSGGLGNSGDIVISTDRGVVFDNSSSAISRIRHGATGEGGNIVIEAESLLVRNNSDISSSSLGQGNAGDILIDVEGSITLNNSSLIRSDIGLGASGNGGDISIESEALYVEEDSRIISELNAESGSAGNILIDVDNQIVFIAGSDVRSSTRRAEGDSGDIEIKAGNLFVIEDSAIDSRIQEGMGQAGNIFIDVDNQLVLDRDSLLVSFVDEDSTGGSGNIQVETDELLLLNGSGITSGVRGRLGNAGNIVVVANDYVSVDNNSSVESATVSRTVGNGGNISIETDDLFLRNNSTIATASQGVGNAGDVVITAQNGISIENSSRIISGIEPGTVGNGGNITIKAQDFYLRQQSQLRANSNGQGNAGSIMVDVTGQFVLDGGSDVNSEISAPASGSAGNIQVDADSVYIGSMSQLSSSTSGQGSTGNIAISADTQVYLEDGQIRNDVNVGAVGNSGTIDINSSSLVVESGSLGLAGISSSTFGQGDAGDITLLIEDTATFSNSALLTSVESEASGNGGDITINADTLNIFGSSISSRSIGEGFAGDIRIGENNRLSMIAGAISTISASTSGGNISINTNQIQLEQDSDIVSRTFARDSNGGNVSIAADEFIVALDDSDIIASALEGKGGNISLETPGFFGENFTRQSLEADPDTLDGNGRVDVNATGSVNGIVTVPDISFIENSIIDLPDNLIAPDQLISSSCIARSQDSQGTLVTTSRDGIVNNPNSVFPSSLATGTVQSIPMTETTEAEMFSQNSNVHIEEPTGIYKLADGRLVMGQACL